MRYIPFRIYDPAWCLACSSIRSSLGLCDRIDDPGVCPSMFVYTINGSGGMVAKTPPQCRVSSYAKSVFHLSQGVNIFLLGLRRQGRDAVGKPVTRLPPHRSPHEVFPHGAPRSGSLPCQAIRPPALLFPAVRLAPVLRPCMSGRSFLYGLRPSSGSQLSTSEYYAVSATSEHELSRLGYSTHVLSS